MIERNFLHLAKTVAEFWAVSEFFCTDVECHGITETPVWLLSAVDELKASNDTFDEFWLETSHLLSDLCT